MKQEQQAKQRKCRQYITKSAAVAQKQQTKPYDLQN